MNLVSFDIFDTVLIRKCGNAVNVFVILAQRLYPNNQEKRNAFILWRKSLCFRKFEADTKLIDFYRYYNEAYFFEYSKDVVIAMELQIESDMLTKNKSISSVVFDQKKKNDTLVAFISDTYLPEAFIKEILVREGLCKEKDLIYISNEVNRRKDTGGLYEYVRNEVKPQKWVHYGGDKICDYEIPKKLGIKSILIDENYSETEKLVAKNSLSCNSYDLSILVGFSRYLRLLYGNTKDASFASDYIAPVFFPYIIHVIEDAQKRGLNKLFFILRDGYILKKIAESLPHAGLELHLLFLSRVSIRFPYCYGVNAQQFLEIFPGKTIVGKNISSIMGMLHLEGFDSQFPYKKIANEIEERGFLSFLFSPEIYSIWQKKAAEEYSKLDAYFCSEGVYEDNVGFVDIGWYGSTRLILNSFFKRHGEESGITYYWGVDDNALLPYFGKYDVCVKNHNITGWSKFVFENYMAACPYPQTISYSYKEGQIIPVFKEDGKYHTNHVIETNIEIVRSFAALLRSYKFDPNVLQYWMLITHDVLKRELVYIDFSPFFEINNDEEFLFRKFTLKETLNYIRMCNLSTNDKVCLEMTYSKGIARILYKLRWTYTQLWSLKNDIFR